jgi:hypothetical protein
MSEALGMKEAGFQYREGWPFMERALAPGELGEIGSSLHKVWDMTKVRDAIRYGRQRWGDNWKKQTI